jgi:hypothetical protein
VLWELKPQKVLPRVVYWVPQRVQPSGLWQVTLVQVLRLGLQQAVLVAVPQPV